MNYNSARNNIETGDVVLIKRASLIYKLKRILTGSKYDLVGFAFWASDVSTGKRRLMIAESGIGGTRIINLSHYMNDKFDVYSGLNMCEWGFASRYILQMSNTASVALLDSAAVLVSEISRLKIGSVRGQTGSQYVAKTLAGFSKRFRCIGESPSPQKLADGIIAQGGAIKYTVDGEKDAN